MKQTMPFPSEFALSGDFKIWELKKQDWLKTNIKKWTTRRECAFRDNPIQFLRVQLWESKIGSIKLKNHYFS